MKTRSFCLTLLLALTALCAFAPRLLANEGDWTESTNVQWWWKYVRQVSIPTTISADRVTVEPVRSTRLGYAANMVTITLTNRSTIDYKGGNQIVMEHGFCDPDPHPWIGPSSWAPVAITKALLPAIPAGRSIQISGIAYTPEKGNYTNYVAVTVSK